MNSKNIAADLKAGLVVFLVALPLCLGIALAQGVPLFSGIISGIVGGVIVGIISGSRLSVSGPAAGLTSIIIASIATLGSLELFLVSVCLAGLMQVILGISRAGFIGYYFPSAVIKGMLAAIGIILILKQIPHFFGYDVEAEGDEAFTAGSDSHIFEEFTKLSDNIGTGSTVIGIISLVILIIWKSKWIQNNPILKHLPAALVAVVISVLMDLFFSLYMQQYEVKDEHLVVLPQIESLSGLYGTLTFPDWTALNNPKVYEIAFVIALIASLESLLSLEAVDKLDPENSISPPNRELIAQGIGNIVCGLIGGIPVTSVIVRSSVNLTSGAKSKLSAIVHGLFFLVAILFLPKILGMIPLSSLAAVLIYVGFNLTKPSMYINIFKQGYDQFLPFIITIVVMLSTDLLKGVITGIFISVIFILRQNYRSPFKMIKDTIDGRVHVFIKLSQNVTFINKGKFIDTFKNIPPGAYVNIDGGRATFVDKDVLELISSFKQSAHIHGIDVVLEEIEEVKVISHH
ncbi:MAG: SulP family inorganic anion transporter [Sphingobacteriaceae bacterium]|nr:SulP family inorganic anion transporter [Sphingobacteriaceae bacterium]